MQELHHISRRMGAALGFAALLCGLPAWADELADISKLMRAGQLPAALQKTDGALAAKPRDPQLRFLKGLILAEQNRNNEAIAVFQKLTEDYPQLPEPYNNLAVLYASAGQYDKARTALEKAIRTNPTYATAHENLGDVYAKLASQAYDKAMQLLDSKDYAPPKSKLAMVRTLSGREAGPQLSGPQLAAVPAAAPAAQPPAAQPAASKPAAVPAQPPAAPPKLASAPAPAPAAPPAKAPTVPAASAPVAAPPAKAPAVAAAPAPAPAALAAQQVNASAKQVNAAAQQANAATPKPATPAAKPPLVALAPAPAPAPKAETPKTEAPKPAASKPDDGAERDAALKAVTTWAKAWSSQDMKGYLNAYADDFQPPRGQSRKAWEADRRARIEGKEHITVTVEAPQVDIKGNTATVRFRQLYVSDRLKANSRKTLLMEKRNGQWRIKQEQSGS